MAPKRHGYKFSKINSRKTLKININVGLYNTENSLHLSLNYHSSHSTAVVFYPPCNGF
jgi:hypothetical protein